jgi:hypothetical protein
MIPGMIFNVTSTSEKIEDSTWEIYTDAYNLTYIYCSLTKSFAYFVNDGTVLYFTSFEGDKNSLLYYLYLSTFKVFIGDYASLTVKDTYPIHMMFEGIQKFIQDFTAPYYQYCKATYESRLENVNNEDRSFTIDASLTKKVFKKTIETIDFVITGNQKSIHKIKVIKKGSSFEINIDLKKNTL